MIIEYQVKRTDLARAYFHSLRHSSRTQLVIFGGAALLIGYNLFVQFRYKGSLALGDFIFAFAVALLLILLFTALLMITAKTQKRILSITPEDIETKIGSKEGKIPWEAVASVTASNDLVVITGKNANAFTIPPQAFTGKEQRDDFIRLAKQYLEAAAPVGKKEE